MFMRNTKPCRLPNFLKQLKTKQVNCRNCQQCLAPRQLTRLEKPYLWSPESVWLLNKSSKSENVSVERNEKHWATSRAELCKDLYSQCNDKVDLSYFFEVQKQCVPVSKPSLSNSENMVGGLHEASRVKFCKAQKNKVFSKIARTDQKRDKKVKSNLVYSKRKSRNSQILERQEHTKLFSTFKEQKTNQVHGTDDLVLERVAEKLSEEWPLFFTLPLDASLCSERIYFDNTILKIKTRGIRLYKTQAYLFKWITKSLWSEPSLRILKLTKHPQENSIRVRWQITGRPRILYPLEIFRKAPSLRYLDYMSILYVGDDEKIAVHRLTNVVPTQRKQRRNPLLSLLALLGLSGTKMHIPGLQEEPVIPSSGGPS